MINKNYFPTFAMFSLILFSFLQCSLPKSDEKEINIAQWRGVNRDGVYNETGLQIKWPESGPELLWKFEGIGKGYGSPSILNNKIFVNGEKDSVSYLFAFDLQGNLLWKSPNGKEFMGEGFSATYPGSRSTPTVIDNMIYTTSGKGRIACFEAETGTEKWAVDIIKDLGGIDSYFGYSESVVVDDEKVYGFPGGNKNNTVALNRYTGEIIWSSKASQDTFSYCSPVLVEMPDKNILLTHSRHFLYTINTDNGRVLGTYFIDHYQYDGEHCNTPLYTDGSVYFIGNEKEVGAVRLELTDEGKMTETWKNEKIKNNFNGYVKVGNHIFTLIKGNKLLAIDTNNGEIDTQTKASTGSIIYADNKFICYGMNGDVNLVSFANNEFSIDGSFKVTNGTGQHFAHPVLNEGVLYIRHGNALMAYKVK